MADDFMVVEEEEILTDFWAKVGRGEGAGRRKPDVTGLEVVEVVVEELEEVADRVDDSMFMTT